MKNIILKSMVLSVFVMGLNACKEKSTDTDVADIQDAPEASATAMNYQVNPEMSVIEWKGSKPLKTHNGIIKLASGSVAVSNNKIEAGNFTIDMNSIEVHDLEGQSRENLENHLKGTVEGKEVDFFNAPKHPFATFTLTGISERDGATIVSGNLTIKEKTHPIEFPADITIDDSGLELKSASFELDRTKWDLNFKSKSVFDNLGDNFVDDEMELTIKVVAEKA